MCVIAGYIGDKPAAPILLEMLRREEGLAAGFYTGIATIHEGKLYYEKVVGDVDALIRQTRAMELPGTIGIAHGRPPGGGGREHGHPFIAQDGKLAYIVNGRDGQYENIPAEEAIGNELLRAGYRFRSAMKPTPEKKAPLLEDGTVVHGSEIKCHEISIAYNELEGCPNRLRDAMMKVYQEHPSEIVGLCLHEDHPDEMAAARHNLPMEIGRDSNGAVYIASTTIAFPESARWQMRMSPLAGATLRRNGAVDIAPFTNPNLLPMGDVPSPTTVERQLCQLMRERGPLNIPDIFDEVDKLWPDGVLGEKEIVTFEALASLLKEGLVEFETRRIPGVLEGTTAPRIWVHWKKKKPTIPRADKTDKTEKRIDGEIIIRDATQEDIDIIAHITGAAFGPMSMERIAEDYFGEPLSEAGWKANKSAEVAEEARSGKYQFIIAELNDKVVGYASWSYDEKRDLVTVGHNAVLPEHQGRGIGSTLQREVVRRFHEAGYKRWKVTTLAHDYPAQRIYEKMGFEEVGRSVVYLHQVT